MTPTPRGKKKRRSMGTGTGKKFGRLLSNTSKPSFGSILFKEDRGEEAGGGGEEAAAHEILPEKTPAKGKGGEGVAKENKVSFQSPNVKGFEMTPIRSSTVKRGERSRGGISGRMQTPGVNNNKNTTPHRTPHFFKSPHRTLFSPPKSPGFRSPVAEMR